MRTVPWWARHSASSGRCPVRSQNAGELLAPLPGAVEVARPLAGDDHVAAARADGDRVVELAAESGGRALVQQARPRLDLPETHQGEPLQRSRCHLDVEAPTRTGLLARLAAEPQHRLRIGVDMERGLDQRKPRVLGRWREVLDQSPRTLQPAVGYRMCTAHRAVVPREEPGDPRRLHHLAAAAAKRIRPLASGDCRVHVVLPPASDGEALEGVRRLLDRKRPPVRVLGLRPCAAPERDFASGEQLDCRMRRHWGILPQRRKSGVARARRAQCRARAVSRWPSITHVSARQCAFHRGCS